MADSGPTLSNLSTESRSFPPSPEFAAQANATEDWYAKADDDREAFWAEQAERLTWAQPWEKVAVMCPHVLYDEKEKLYRMWYSGGEHYEPDAIGHATSKDGLVWEKHRRNPIFRPDPALWKRPREKAS